MVCAGADVNVVAFHNSSHDHTLDILENDLGVPIVPRKNVITLPEEVTPDLVGSHRNLQVLESLKSVTGRFVMAQPYDHDFLKERYVVPYGLQSWLNDKQNMGNFIPPEYLPARPFHFRNGAQLRLNSEAFPLPCVIKVASASSGDGVWICRTDADVEEGREKFKHVTSSIFVEEMIDADANVGIQFGVPYDPSAPIQIIGFNEQLIGRNGSHLGGCVGLPRHIPGQEIAEKVILESILPKVRALGWCGIGALDVLIKDGHPYFIDPNFRMTAMSAFIILEHNKNIPSPFMSFTGSFTGDMEAFRRMIVPIASSSSSDQKLYIIALSNVSGEFHFNACVLFDNQNNLAENVDGLKKHGIRSTSFDYILA